MDLEFSESRIMTYSKNEIRYLLANKRYKMGAPRSVNTDRPLLPPPSRRPPSWRPPPPSNSAPLQALPFRRPPSRHPASAAPPRLGSPTPASAAPPRLGSPPGGGGGGGGAPNASGARARAACTFADSAAVGPAGKPVLNDAEYDALRLQLKKDGSSVSPAR